jgi:hypothetical protein
MVFGFGNGLAGPMAKDVTWLVVLQESAEALLTGGMNPRHP